MSQAGSSKILILTNVSDQDKPENSILLFVAFIKAYPTYDVF